MSINQSCLLVFPCFNPTVTQWLAIDQFCLNLQSKSDNRFDFLVIDDGSPNWQEPINLTSQIQIVRLPQNLGKGGVLRAAIKYLKQHHSIFCFHDFDLPFLEDDLLGITNSVQKGADFCIGDRSLNQGSNRFSRKVAHKIFRLFMRMIITGGVADTQCGIKAYDANAIKFLIKNTKINGFLFDVEWIYIALKHKMSVRCWPVQVLDKHESSSLRSFKIFSLLAQLTQIISCILSKKYEIPELFQYMEKKRKTYF